MEVQITLQWKLDTYNLELKHMDISEVETSKYNLEQHVLVSYIATASVEFYLFLLENGRKYLISFLNFLCSK